MIPLIAFGVLIILSSGVFLLLAIQARSRLYVLPAFGVTFLGLLVILAGFSLVSVGPSERLLVFNRLNGKLSDPRGPGYTLVNPITHSYEHYDISRQTYTMSAAYSEGDLMGDDSVIARTSDGQTVTVEITVIYSIDPTKVNEVHVNWPRGRYRDEMVRPLLRSVIRDAVGGFDVETAYRNRERITAAISEAVIPAMEVAGFDVESILLRDIAFTPEYANAIEAAQVAEVNIRAEEFRVQSVEQQAAQTEARARGEADARIIEAEAEAEALSLVAAVLAENPALLEYQYVQNLSDNVQIMALPANSPYLFDLQTLIENVPTPQPEAPSDQ